MTSWHFNPLSDFVPSEKIPLAINAVQPGLHPALAFHNHDYSELVIVYAGEARHIVEDESYEYCWCRILQEVYAYARSTGFVYTSDGMFDCIANDTGESYCGDTC